MGEFGFSVVLLTPMCCVVFFVQHLRGHADSVYCVDIASNGALLVTGSGDDTAALWSVADGSRTHVLEGHTDTVSDVAFNPAGTLVATASYDGTVKVWDAASGELKQTLEGPSGEVEWLQWHMKVCTPPTPRTP